MLTGVKPNLVVQYIANIRLPTEKAHGAQIMKACEALAQTGVDLELVVPRRHNPITEEPFAYYHVKPIFKVTRLFSPDTVAWGRIGFLFQSFMFGVKAARYVKRHESVIYGRDEIVLTVLGLLTRKKIFWESHDGAWNFWTRYVAKRASGVIVTTKAAAEFYKKKGVEGTHLFAVPNGIDLADFAHPESQEAARTRLGLPLHKKIALYVGRLDGWKGTGTLLEASRTLPEDIVVAVIGGEKRQIEELKNKYPKVLFLGFHPYRELANNLAAGDFLILPNTGTNETSAQFTSPLKLFSYMAAGKPIIASDLSSMREILHDTEAVFVEADNSRALAEAIVQAAQEPQRVVELGVRARREVEGYTWEKRAGKVRACIEQHV